MGDGDYKVSSEIYKEHDYGTSSKPIVDKNNIVSKFCFRYPQYRVSTDPDGDLIVPRKTSKNTNNAVIEIEHMKSTVLDLVGLQIWRGSLLLADWLIHNHHSILSSDSYILELGSGVGLTSIVASMFAPVFCTDVNKGNLLSIIRSNIERNKHIVKHAVNVLELNFTEEALPKDILRNLAKIRIIIAADTVYDDRITDAFVRTLQLLLSTPPEKCVYVALEKRYVFTIADCASTAPCYEYFLQRLRQIKNLKTEDIPLSFPKFFEYERVKELVLLKITSVL
ncbi:methyltransferase-like protein 22 [Anoplophora glabripennis]|uniref:methyltransferase-like protein 22 n=1 Tax=Anoplophora glabripennis TaxID=217634 RepID=UPI000874F56F|nr:methyltransferase-like protein 22 [Anoplophora glabripennis]XP_018571517.1 methyltransferase-like protein 22 [Anoplophora glabripennis]